MQKKYYMGRFELYCLVFNSLIYKIFTHYPASFAKYSGSAAWLTAVFCALIFLLILHFILRLYAPHADKGLIEAVRSRFGNNASLFVSAVAVIYFAFSGYYALFSVCNTLKSVSYVTSPLLFIGFFILLASVSISICGENAVRRVHSLSALGVAFAAVIISLLSLRYADIHNLTPILGTGPANVFSRGLSTIFLYSDILVIFFLPKHSGEFSFSKTVMLSAAIAALINVGVITATALNLPYELSAKIALPLYPLTKTANLGKFPLRFDTIYHIATTVSAILYLSLAVSILTKGVKTVIKSKKLLPVSLCFLLCLTLCGCYDSREIEENAYVIAIGIDNGESEKYKYTFQISNPLESGGNIGAQKKAEENSDSADDKNKTVDNIIVEADDFFLAWDKLKRVLSKDASMSHLNVIAFSADTARNGALEHSELLLHEREVRPGTNLCLVPSASEYLLSVNPTLEESTVRYYELFFKNRDVPSAPVTELRDFVGRSLDSGHDAVIPIVSDDGLSGMGIFSNGVLKSEVDADDAVIYKMLCGDLYGVAVNFNNSSKIVSSKGNPKIKISDAGENPEVTINVRLKAQSDNLDKDFVQFLEQRAETFLYKSAILECDVLGVGRYFKSRFITHSQWENYDWNTKLQKCRFNVNILP